MKQKCAAHQIKNLIISWELQLFHPKRININSNDFLVKPPTIQIPLPGGNKDTTKIKRQSYKEQRKEQHT
jgi:hypothetical protein